MSASELRDGILDAKYIDMVSLADFILRDCNLPSLDQDGNAVAGQADIAASIFRWAVLLDEDDMDLETPLALKRTQARDEGGDETDKEDDEHGEH